MLGSILVRSGVVCWRAGGIRWRDTFYRTDELRAHMRFRFI